MAGFTAINANMAHTNIAFGYCTEFFSKVSDVLLILYTNGLSNVFCCITNLNLNWSDSYTSFEIHGCPDSM